MKKQEKLIITPAIILAFCLALPFTTNAMHIMEGFLPVGHFIAWSLIALPFLIAGYLSIKKTVAKDRKSITLLAMSGAFVFVLSSLKIPSVTGSCSHMTGTGLAAILFRCKYTWCYSTYFSGASFGAWRLHHAWSKYLFDGYSGTFCILHSL